MSLSKKFDQLMSHLNGEDNELGAEFRKLLVDHVGHLEERNDFLCRLEAAGVDNWCGYDLAFDDEEEDDDE